MEENKLAEFYKCALQVNCYDYIKNRGQNHSYSEEEYNNDILKYCKEENIKVIGLADHATISQQAKLKSLLEKNDIIVFNGFEVASSEKIHIVCLFPENSKEEEIIKCMGAMEIKEKSSVSSKTLLEIINIVEDKFGGICYLAHITDENGILDKGQMNHIWKDEKVKICQINSTIDQIDSRYKNIINNTEPQYKREKEMAFINAKDICRPEDLKIKESCCYIKMSRPCFNSFKMAFCDPVSRVKLSSDINQNFYTYIESIKIYGGYLDGMNITISKHLNTIIGGRGTGKSTLLEIIRYALEIETKSIEAKKDIEALMKSNFGNDSRVEMIISTNKYQGKKYKIIKRYAKPIVIEDMETNKVFNLLIENIIPKIEIYGQNEILELIKNDDAKLQILNRFFPEDDKYEEYRIEIVKKLNENALLLNDLYDKKDTNESDINKLPRLIEQETFYNELGIKEKASVLANNKKEETRINELIKNINDYTVNLTNITSNIDEKFIEEITNQDKIRQIEQLLKTFNENINNEIKNIEKNKEQLKEKIQKIKENLLEKHIRDSEKINKEISTIPNMQGKTAQELLDEYLEIIKNIEIIKPKEKDNQECIKLIKSLEEDRNNLLEELAKNKDKHDDDMRKIIKKINNKQLNNKVRIQVLKGKNRSELIKYLARKDGLAEKGLEWINEANDFSIETFTKDIQEGKEKLLKEYKQYGLTDGKAEIISQISRKEIFEMQSIELKDIIDIQLFIEGKNEYKSLNKLSKGQQCTAILYILLLENVDPLIIDQPEDNLDNSFISSDFIDVLRKNKMKRQFIFATHNANIPVFGDSECIIVMEEEKGHGISKKENIGSIDDENVRECVINILEGGKGAFEMRKAKYGI